MFTHMSSTQCNHQHSTHFSHLHGKTSIAVLYSSLLRWCTEVVTAALISSYDSNCLSKSCSFTRANTSEPPTMYQILHITISMRCCIDLEQNDTIIKQFWLFMVKSQPHLILQKCAVIVAIDCHTNWHRMVKHKPILAEECDQYNFQNQMSVPWEFFLGNNWAHHSEFWHFSWRSHDCIHDSSTVKIWWAEARRTHVVLWSS